MSKDYKHIAKIFYMCEIIEKMLRDNKMSTFSVVIKEGTVSSTSKITGTDKSSNLTTKNGGHNIVGYFSYFAKENIQGNAGGVNNTTFEYPTIFIISQESEANGLYAKIAGLITKNTPNGVEITIEGWNGNQGNGAKRVLKEGYLARNLECFRYTHNGNIYNCIIGTECIFIDFARVTNGGNESFTMPFNSSQKSSKK